MKMKSSYRIVHSMGAVALVLAGAAQAASTNIGTDFLDQWSVTGGIIKTDPCSARYECGNPLTSDGFLTRLVKDTSHGKQYFQTIVTMPGVTAAKADLDKLEFTDENLVSYSNISGIIDKQRISQTQIVPNPGVSVETRDIVFKNGSLIGTGWATDFVDLTQSIEDVKDPNDSRGIGRESHGDGFKIDFLFKQLGYSSDVQNPTGKGMKLTNYVPLGAKSADPDRQDFVLVETQGSFTKAGSVNLPVIAGVPPRGGAMSWVDDDRVQAVWIGEDLPTAGQTFGYAGYTKFVDPVSQDVAEKVHTFSLVNTLGNATTGVPDPSIQWNSTVWGDLKTVDVTVPSNWPIVPTP